MKRTALTVLAAAMLFLSVGVANAGPILRIGAAKAGSIRIPVGALVHDLDFGKLPDGWKVARNPNGATRGILNHLLSDSKAMISVQATDSLGRSLETLTKKVAENTRAQGHEVVGPTMDKAGNWSIEITIIEKGQKTGKGFAILRTFKNDPEGIYLFHGMWPNSTDVKTVEQARAIAKGATLK